LVAEQSPMLGINHKAWLIDTLMGDN